MTMRRQTTGAPVTAPPMLQRWPLFLTRPFAPPGALVAPAPQEEAATTSGTPGAGYHFADIPVRGDRHPQLPHAVQRATPGAAGMVGSCLAPAPPLVTRPNPTGLPNRLKAGIEALSGIALDDVRVHSQSTQPAQLQALAYTQGTNIYVAPGQEQHLPHEAWHVVQQAEGRVQPTRQMKQGVPVNEEEALEHEAEVMGARALSGAVQRQGPDAEERSRRSSGRSRGAARPTSWPSIAQLVNLPKDSRGGLADIRIQKGETEITAKDLQIGLIEQLSTVGEKGFGYRLLSFRYDGQGLLRDDSEYHKEKHGMQPWPADIDEHVGDIKLLVQATLTAAGQLQYLQDNFAAIHPTHVIIVDVDWYRERTQSDVGFHKDSRGTTLFVNLTYNNAEKMQGASTKPDLEGQKALEKKLPQVVRKDLRKRRKRYNRNPEPGKVTEREVGPYARLSFADPSIWHSTPLLGHRIERVQPPTDVQTLETYLPRAGYPVYKYRGILKYYRLEQASDYQVVFDYFRQQRDSNKQQKVDSMEELKTALQGLGMTDYELYGYATEYTPAGFWKALPDKETDLYNQHGISENIKPQNAGKLTEDVKKRCRPLSQRLDKEPELQGALDAEAKRPRTFIRTWVRLVPRVQ